VLEPGFVGDVIIEPLHEGAAFDPAPGTTFEVWYGEVIGQGVVLGL
jgi:hypothetical protein